MTEEAAAPPGALARTELSETLPEFLARKGHEAVYDVVIVGSGYGGSVAAHALAAAAHDRPDLRVLLLERGREFKPGAFPATFGELPRELRIGRQETGEVMGHEGLFDVRLGPDVVAMVANGLGGGSLINAGVMLDPEPDDIAGALGTAPHRDTLVAHLRTLKAGQVFTRARRLLGGQVKRDGLWVRNDLTRLPPTPGSPYALRKAQALDDLAADRGTTTAPMEVTVAWDPGPNIAGAPLSACIQCGDCMTGCNAGAKNSLDRSLLYGAKQLLRDRLTIVTGATVGSLAQEHAGHMAGQVAGWRLRLFHTSALLQDREVGLFDEATSTGVLYLHARRVVLAAGTLGSPEILMRSRSDQLQFSARLGESFSGNGDDIAAVHRLPNDVHGGADERVPPDARGIGPTTTARITLQGRHKPFQVEEFAVPGAVKRLFDELVTTGWTLSQLPKGDWKTHRREDDDPLAVDPAAMQKTLLVGLVGHDSADGSLRLAQPLRPRDAAPQLGALRIHWPQARHGEAFDDAHETLRRFVEAPGRRSRAGEPEKSGKSEKPVLVANPMWRLLPDGLEDLVSQPRGPVLTVHPLGGCRIGADAVEGVVDTLGRVYDAGLADAHATFATLLVLDGSIIGSSLGANPALTISALALHAMDHHVQAWGLGQPTFDPETEPGVAVQDGNQRPVPPSPCVPAPDDAPPLPSDTHLSITERLWGRVTLKDSQGTLHHQVLELTLSFAAQPASTLVGPRRQPLDVLPERSRLRLYSASDWDGCQLQAADDNERGPFVVCEAALRGELRFLHRKPSGPVGRTLRGLWAYIRNRGLRDAYQRLREPLRHDEQRKPFRPKDLFDFARLASRNGQRRLFEYALEVDEILGPPGEWQHALRFGDRLEGVKELGYARRSSPWTQLTEMQLLKMPGLAELKGDSPPTLKLDARFLAQQGKPLLHIERQRNHADALSDLMSLGLYLLRVLLDAHLWSFRKPDRREPRIPYRLPTGILGLPAPEITTLAVDRWREEKGAADQPVTIRLTRYQPPAGKPRRGQPPVPPVPPKPPLVMLHGYSASGTTFTHPSLGADAAAAFFCRAGRDVWVVDLRTSCGLPSALLPWAMEQPALVDIPAALLHVRNVTGQKVDVLAHCIGGAMLGMALLSDAAWVRSGKLELGTDTWLTSEHFGTLSAFNGAGSASEWHPTVNRVVLSQKGPLLRYTEANVLRAYVLQFARRWLLPVHYSFQASRDPGVSEQLLDRLLSSLPYPAADFDVENPMWPCARTEWVASRHRLDALFGRVFTAANLRRATREAIDELFGPINLDTVAQTIHFARWDTITNQRGRGEFVTRRRLRERWRGIPTLVVHGRDNGLVDPYTHRLLTEQLQAAGVPVHELPPIPCTGHQDCLIGVGARERVFGPIEEFLAGRTLPSATPVQPLAPMVCAEPWIGPRLAPVAGGGVRVAAMSRPDQGECMLWLVPVRTNSGAGMPYEMLQGPGYPWPSSLAPLTSGKWHRAIPDPAMVPPQPGVEVGWLAVMVYPTEETTARPPRREAGEKATAQPTQKPLPEPEPGAEPAASTAAPVLSELPVRNALVRHPVMTGSGFPLSLHNRLWEIDRRSARSALVSDAAAPAVGAPADVVKAVQHWLDGENLLAMRQCFVPLQAVQQAARLQVEHPTPPPGFSFAVASCQYPDGLFDRLPARASLAAMADEPVQMALMVGDQIYADATAGLVDPTRRDELYDQPHEKAFRQRGMRAVMRRMPVIMLLDDHELFDNWQPLPEELPHRARRVRMQRYRIDDAREYGIAAYLKYQRMSEVSASIDQDFLAGGHPFYLLDTRTGRARGAASSGDAGGAIVSSDRMLRLECWLTQHADRVKFVVTPSMLLPQLAEVANHSGNACRGDAWDGFPDSLARLLQHIGNPGKPIRHTVFLSGDAHHSLYTEAFVGAARVKLVSVHSSALYAPYPYANGRPSDLCDGAETGAGLGIALSTTTVHAPPGDGYAVIEVVDDDGAPALRITFAKASHRDPHTVRLA